MKRFGSDNFENNKNTDNKKPKLDSKNLDDLWGEELDAKDVDDCFELASQAGEKTETIQCTQQNNVSILPSYGEFQKKTLGVHTSTQSKSKLDESLQIASTSTKTVNITKGLATDFSLKRTRSVEKSDLELETEVKRLEEEFVEKEGEITILRTQMKSLRVEHEQEQTKKQKEFTEKLTATVKELNATKGELEFKNLEIANLKQKVVEVARFSGYDTGTNPSQSLLQTQRIEKSTSPKTCKADYKIELITRTKFPLQRVIEPTIFNYPVDEKYLINIKHDQVRRSSVPFLQNQLSQELTDQFIRLQPKCTMVNGPRQLNVDFIYADLMQLIKSSTQELQSELNRTQINKVVCVSEQLLHNLYTFLIEFKSGTSEGGKNGDPKMVATSITYLEEHRDSSNCSVYDPQPWCDNELGISARQVVACVAEILPYSRYLQGYLLMNTNLLFDPDEKAYFKYMPCIKPKLNRGYYNDSDYMQLILSIAVTIREMKKGESFPGFLSSLTVLLNKIYLSHELKPDSLPDRIFREVCFSCSDVRIICYLMRFVKNASLQRSFVCHLCKTDSGTSSCTKNGVQIKRKERVLSYSEDTCVVQILCVLFERLCVPVQLYLYLDAVQFLSNCFKCKVAWMYYEEAKSCDCLCAMIKLSVNVVYKTMKELLNDTGLEKSTDEIAIYSEIVKVSAKLLHVINFRASDLVVKYISTYSEFKMLLKNLAENHGMLDLNKSDIEILQELSASEEPTDEEKNLKAVDSVLWD